MRQQSCMPSKPKIGSVGWMDLTIDDAPRLRDFYSSVVGWTSQPVPLDGYSDFIMVPPASDEGAAAPDGVAGICHARGPNSGLPACWLMYIVVADLDASLKATIAGGGSILRPRINTGGSGSFAVIKDPAGAACALFESA